MLINKIGAFNAPKLRNNKTNINFNANPKTKIISNLTKDSFEKVMTEKDKMLNGLLYFAGDSVLREDRRKAQYLLYEYNKLHPYEEYSKRIAIIKELFGKTGEKFRINSDFKCDYGYNIEIGNNFFSNYNLVILDTAKVIFGDDVLIGPNCGFYTAEHPIDPILRATGQQVAKPITVGNNVWVCGGVNVVGGVNIGDNVVVGAGSVVVKDLPPNTVCVGNPCKPKREISPEEIGAIKTNIKQSIEEVK